MADTPTSSIRSSVAVIGDVSWDEVLRVPELPGPAPSSINATSRWTGAGSPGATHALTLARLGLDVRRSPGWVATTPAGTSPSS